MQRTGKTSGRTAEKTGRRKWPTKKLKEQTSYGYWTERSAEATEETHRAAGTFENPRVEAAQVDYGVDFSYFCRLDDICANKQLGKIWWWNRNLLNINKWVFKLLCEILWKKKIGWTESVCLHWWRVSELYLLFFNKTDCLKNMLSINFQQRKSRTK